MALSITVTRSWNFPAGRPVTLAALRLGAFPGVSIAGSVTNGDIAAGAITPSLTSPGAYFYGALTGTNTYVVTLNPALTAYADGVQLLGKVGTTSTAAATATLNVNGLGAKNIYHRNGTAPKAGDIVANDIIQFRYNTSRNAGAGGWDIMEVLPSATIRPAVNVTTGTVNAQAVVNSPPLTAYQVGQLLLVTAGAALTNTGAMTLNCDGLGVRSVKRQDGSALLSQDWVAAQTHLLYDDGTNFVLLGRRADNVVVAHCRNLTIENDSATPNSKATVTADEVVLKTSDGQSILHSTVSLTIDASLGVALNGFETGVTEGASIWYYVWLISNGTTIAAVLEEATGGAVPGGPDLSNAAFTGYVYKALVGQIRNDGSSNFVRFCQYDREVAIDYAVGTVLSAKAVGVNDTFEVLAGADLTAFRATVPPTARYCHGFAGSDNATDNAHVALGAAKSDGTLAGAGDIVGLKLIHGQNMANVSEGVAVASSFTGLPVRGAASRNIQWKSRVTTETVTLVLTGYIF